MTDVEKLVEFINEFFGCDAAYFDVNPFDLAMHLIEKGVKLPVQCGECLCWDPAHSSDGQGWCPRVVGYRNSTWYCAGGRSEVTAGDQ